MVHRAIVSGLIVLAVSTAGCGQQPVPVPADPTPGSSSAWDLLAATEKDPLRWQIVHSRAHEPPDLVEGALRDALDEVFGRSAHRFEGTSPLPAAFDREQVWTVQSLYPVSMRLQEAAPGWLSIVFMDGTYEDEDDPRRIFGVELFRIAYVFPDEMYVAMAGGDRIAHPARAEVERAVAVHEAGHALGLVGHPAPMLEPRLPSEEDDPCQCHSDREDSVMYYEMDTADWYLEKVFQDGAHIPYRFDEHDLADLAHARGLALARHRG